MGGHFSEAAALPHHMRKAGSCLKSLRKTHIKGPELLYPTCHRPYPCPRLPAKGCTPCGNCSPRAFA